MGKVLRDGFTSVQVGLRAQLHLRVQEKVLNYYVALDDLVITYVGFFVFTSLHFTSTLEEIIPTHLHFTIQNTTIHNGRHEENHLPGQWCR